MSTATVLAALTASACVAGGGLAATKRKILCHTAKDELVYFLNLDVIKTHSYSIVQEPGLDDVYNVVDANDDLIFQFIRVNEYGMAGSTETAGSSIFSEYWSVYNVADELEEARIKIGGLFSSSRVHIFTNYRNRLMHLDSANIFQNKNLLYKHYTPNIPPTRTVETAEVSPLSSEIADSPDSARLVINEANKNRYPFNMYADRLENLGIERRLFSKLLLSRRNGTFRISNKSLLYRWNKNGNCMERILKFSKDPYAWFSKQQAEIHERIALATPTENKSFTVHLNESKVERIIALTTFFLNAKKRSEL